jgi:regulator of nucleoside diphosphate kinase
MAEHLPPITIARPDYERLKPLAEDAVRKRHPVGRFLMSEISRAVVFETNKMPDGIACLDE